MFPCLYLNEIFEPILILLQFLRLLSYSMLKNNLILVRLICLLIRSLCFAEIDWHTASSTAANQRSQINVLVDIPPTAQCKVEWVRWSADADAWTLPLQITYSFLYCMGVVRQCKNTHTHARTHTHTHTHTRAAKLTTELLWWHINGLLPHIKHHCPSLLPDTLWRVSNLTSNLLKRDFAIIANSLFHSK